jgi:hypothetical protein
LREIKEKEK